MPIQDQNSPSAQNQSIPPVARQPNILPQQPAATQQPTIPQNAPIYAGFLLRNAALFLDTWIASIPSVLISALLTLPLALTSGEPLSQAFGKPPISIIFNSLAVILMWSYFVLTTYKFGGTLGKKVFKLQVISENGAPITLSKTIIREIPGKIISGLILAIGYLMVAFSKEKQGLHDHLAGTHVIRTEPITGRTKLAVFVLTIFPILFLIILVLLVAFPLFFAFKTKTSLPANKPGLTQYASPVPKKGLVSTAALSRDQQRKSDLSLLATELLTYKMLHSESYPNDLSALLVASPENPNPLQALPLPPNNSEPQANYGYTKCSANEKEEAILYTQLEETGYYYVWRSAANATSDSASLDQPACS